MSARRLFTGEDVAVELTGRVATLSLDRPPVNAMRTRTWQELEAALLEIRGAPEVSVVVLRSAVPGVFSAGADVKELPMTPTVDEERQRLARTVLQQVTDAPQAVIAAVDGPALGGACALACAADIRVGTAGASFGLPEIDVGRCGGGRHLMRHLPQGTVRLMYFTGDRLDADAAARLGLLNLVVEQIDAEVDDLARRVASKSPTALRLAKQALNLAEESSLHTGYEIEQQFSLRLAGTEEAAEAAAAFREKREPVWPAVDAEGER